MKANCSGIPVSFKNNVVIRHDTIAVLLRDNITCLLLKHSIVLGMLMPHRFVVTHITALGVVRCRTEHSDFQTSLCLFLLVFTLYSISLQLLILQEFGFYLASAFWFSCYSLSPAIPLRCVNHECPTVTWCVTVQRKERRKTTLTCHGPLHLPPNVYFLSWIKLDRWPCHVTVTEKNACFYRV